MKIIFATTNDLKYDIARHVADDLGVELERRQIDIAEIQGEDGDEIIRDKVLKAYEAIGEPVVVSDDSWSILGLNGFPGAYMKSMNHWFTTQDFINLTAPLADRRVVLTQRLAYHDGTETIIISEDTQGSLLAEPKGHDDKSPNYTIITMDGDNGLSVAEVMQQGLRHQNRKAAAVFHRMFRQLAGGTDL